MLPPVVLWVDPGKMTGLASLVRGRVEMNPSRGLEYVAEGPHEFEGREEDFVDACMLIEGYCGRYRRALAIGWERFDINEGTHKKTQEGIKDALHVIGVCRYMQQRYDCRFLGEAHQHTPDRDDQRMLKALGWWVPGKDDAQSAACHMLRWLIRENELTPLQRQLVYG